MKRKIKRELRYIRYKVCRNIYYADQCPMDNRKNYGNIIKNIAMGAMMAVMCLAVMFAFILMA